MAVTDKSGNGLVTHVGVGARSGYSLWNANANGDGTPVPWPGGAGNVVVALATGGSMGGGTINIKTRYRGKDSTVPFVSVDNTDQLNITVPGSYAFQLSGCEIIASLVGSSGASGVCVLVDGFDL